jgi:glycosyltransferase involved in cell wall biosynthesis
MTKNALAIITFPMGDAGCISTNHLINILSPLCPLIYLITGNKGSTYFMNRQGVVVQSLQHGASNSTAGRILQYIITQIRLTKKTVRILPETDILFISHGADMLMLPHITARLLRKRTVLLIEGSTLLSYKHSSSKLFPIVHAVTRFNFAIANQIIIYSSTLIDEYELKPYTKKLLIAPRHYIDTQKFQIQTPVDERKKLIGYIGRFSEEKGVINFVRALPSLAAMDPDYRFLICGDGYLKSEVLNAIPPQLKDRIDIRPWVPHDQLPALLNTLKCLVIPSYTEAGPMILIEAMACGTPSVVTRVGCVADIVKNDESGFLLDDNTPDTIACSVHRAMNHQNLALLSQKARAAIERDYTFEQTVARFEQAVKVMFPEVT